MSVQISGARIRKELGRHVPAHQISVSEASRHVIVHPHTVQEASLAVTYAAREGIAVLPLSKLAFPVSTERWHIRLSLSSLSAITDYSPESGLVGVQTGGLTEDLADWLLERDCTLAAMPDPGHSVEVWEFLLSPFAGRFGPRFGCKWDQVVALTAVLPSGRVFRNSLAPARATGPDFSRLILMGQGRFGIPLEVYFKVKRVPSRRVLMAFSITDMAGMVDQAWTLARDVGPTYLEIGAGPGHKEHGLPDRYALVELWGEGKRLTVRRELVRKHLDGVATPVDAPYETLLGLDDVHGFDRRNCRHMYAHRDETPALLEMLLRGCNEVSQLRLRGFVDNQVCVTTGNDPGDSCWALATSGRGAYDSPDGEGLLRAVAEELDPQGILRRVPELWTEEVEGE